MQLEHVKPRLLGHWETTSGQNLLYVHLNRIIKRYDLNMLYLCGPGHGGPALVANAYLEGTYSEVYPNIGQDEVGLKRLFTSSPSLAGSRATSLLRHRGRSTKAVSWTTSCRTPTALPSTIPS